MLFDDCSDHVCLTFTLEEWFARSEHERSWLRRYAMQFQYTPRIICRFYVETWEKVSHFFPELRGRISAGVSAR